MTARQPTLEPAPHDRTVILGPLPIYAAKPYAHLPPSFGAVEYVPEHTRVRWLRARSRERAENQGLRVRSLPLPKGLGLLSSALRPLARRLLPPELRNARALVVTSPFQSSICPVLAPASLVYHVFDDYSAYGWTDAVLRERESAILRHSRHLVVVSDGLARLYQERYGVASEHISVLPNGFEPAPSRPIPQDLESMPRPRIGTLGNVNSRLRLDWVLEILESLPSATWTFVGGIATKGLPGFLEGLAELRRHPRCFFLGTKPYEDLPAYAAGFDVAIFPFAAHVLTRVSSPTRFFSQLPFGQPILVSDACEQLVDLQPITRVCASAGAFVDAFRELERAGFSDGHAALRREYATQCTWEARAWQLRTILERVAPVGHATRSA